MNVTREPRATVTVFGLTPAAVIVIVAPFGAGLGVGVGAGVGDGDGVGEGAGDGAGDGDGDGDVVPPLLPHEASVSDTAIAIAPAQRTRVRIRRISARC
jgi:hypothetical protein